jgi:acetyl esterase/lipase
LTVVVGTRDIMLPDARDLVARAQAAGIDAVLLQSPGGVHCYPVTAFLPEARQARQLIAARLSS